MIGQNNQDKYKHILPEYFTLNEIAEACGYADTGNLRRYCADGSLYSIKVDKIRLVPTINALEFIEKTNKNKK